MNGDVPHHLPVAEVDELGPETVSGSEVTALMRQVTEQFGEYVKLNKKMGEDAGVDLSEVDDAGQLADTIAAAISAKVSDKQGLLTETNPLKRLELVMAFMEGGPEMLSYLDEKTPVQLHVFNDFPDYQPYLPGAKPEGGRSLDNAAFSFERLGKWSQRVNPSKMAYPLRGSLMEAVTGSLDEATLAEREAGD